MKKIIVYDLNQTLYKKSSKDEFFKFICYKKGHKLVHLFQMGWMQLLRKLHLVTKTHFKENFFDYLKHLPPGKVKEYSRQFWEIEYPEHFRKEMIDDILKYVQQGTEVYIITGGLEIYTKYLEKILPVKVLGTLTEYTKENYKIVGKACNGPEKVRRLKKDTSDDYRLLEAYSDDDEEILHHAEKGYLLREGEMVRV